MVTTPASLSDPWGEGTGDETPPGWPTGWWAPLGEHAPALESELACELAGDHPLSGIALRAAGRSERNDDVLFAFRTDSRVALVHLTWSGKTERAPWPKTTVYTDYDSFVASQPDDR